MSALSPSSVSPSCHPTDLFDLHRGMVSFDSISTPSSGRPCAEEPLATWLAQVAGAMGFRTLRQPTEPGFADNLLLLHEVGADRPWILLESHLDTVAVEGMTIAPFAAERRAGRIYGRGACDTKGSGAAMLWALKDYAAAAEQPNNVALLFAINEEAGMEGVRAFAQHGMDQAGFRPALAIIGEPTLLEPVVAHNGVLRLELMARGVSCHSSDPSRGRSAISDLVRLIARIETEVIAQLDASHPLTGRAQGSINLIRGGSAENIVPGHACCVLDRRVVPGESVEQAIAQVQAILDRMQAADPHLRLELGIRNASPPLNGLAPELLAHVQQILTTFHIPNAPRGAAYGTDAGHLAGIGVPAVVLGPGDIAQAHTADEWIAESQLLLAAQVYQELLQRPLPAT